MKKQKVSKIITAALCSIVVLFMATWTEVGSYIREQKAAVLSTYTTAQSDETQDALMKQIRAEAEKRYIAPIDAQVDRVWKAVPGYNGLEVDVDASYKKSKAAGSNAPLQLVYREIKPNVTLNQLPAEPIYRGNPNKPMTALMINVAWGTEYIDAMLDTLKKENVKATFFFDGSWVKKNPEVAKKIADAGHEIGNHAYSHPNMSQYDEARQRAEMTKTEMYIKQAVGVNSKWFAPPSGDFNALTVKVARQEGMKTVLWTVDTIDWQKPSPATIMERVRKKIGPGSLILMHPTASSSQALAGMIQMIKQQSLQLGTVSSTLSEERVKDDEVE